jgi:CheY-like chemotaxis protein
VLIVEDHADTRESLRLLLQAAGYEVHEASDGASGVECVLRVRPDIALIDIGLPTIDGYEVARRVRANPNGQAVRLVALSGYAEEKDRQRSAAAGFDLHLTKPVDGTRLIEIVAAA